MNWTEAVSSRPQRQSRLRPKSAALALAPADQRQKEKQQCSLTASWQASKLARCLLIADRRCTISIKRTSLIILCARSRPRASSGFIGEKISRAHWKRPRQKLDESITATRIASEPVTVQEIQ